MTRLVAPSVLGLIVAGIPLTIDPAWFLVVLAIVAAGLCAGGAAAASVPVLTAAAVLMVVEYAAALWASGAPFDVLSAAGVGILLFLLLEIGDLEARRGRVPVTTFLTISLLRHWLAIAGVAAVLVFSLAGAAALLRLAIPPRLSPLAGVLAASGALLAVFGVQRLVTARR